LRQWLSEIERYACENVSKLLIGLKSDLEDHRQVPYDEAKAVADSFGLQVIECSSKTNRNVQEAMLALCKLIGRKLDVDLDPTSANLAHTPATSASTTRASKVDDDEASAESISDEELEVDLGTLATKTKAKPAAAASAATGKKKHKAAKTNVNVFRLGLDSLAKDVEVMTGDPCFCQRCGVMLSSISKIEDLTPAAAEKRTAASPVGPTFTPAPPIHERFAKHSWVGSAADGKGKEPEVAAGDAPAPSPSETTEEMYQYWVCEFCGFANRVSLDEGEIPHEQTVDYVVKPPTTALDPTAAAAAAAASTSAPSPPNIVFAIDVSGSMCVTLEVDGRHDFKGTAERNARDRAAAGDAGWVPRVDRSTGKTVTHVSRLQCLQIAIEAQIKKIARETPEKRVGLITFSDEVTLIGDGEQAPVVISGEKLSSWEKLGEIGSQFKLTKGAREAEAALIKRLWELEESGATALGPALRLAVAVAGSAPGSSVVLCTDGLANLGLGSLEGMSRDFVAFYTEIAEQAVLRGVGVSILSLIGSECRMEQLAVVAEKTGGHVERVDPRVLKDQLDAIVGAPETIAYGAMAMCLLHRGLRFRGEAADETEQRLWLVKDLGNVSARSECTFGYGFRPAEEVDLKDVHSVPFQVQLLYTRKDGGVYLRVATASVALTEDRAEAERKADIAVVRANALRQAARAAKEGDYERAQLETRAAARFLMRNAVETETAAFAAQVDGMDAVLRAERAREQAGTTVADQRERQARRDDETATAIYKLL